MIDTTKLLIILPDVAYVAELLEGKKPYTFTLHACKQVNGDFVTKKGPSAEAIAKLFQKLESGESYHLVLPDALFIDTIVSVDETTESKIQSQLEKSTLADLKLSEETHYLKTIILNKLKGTTRVQLAAISKDQLSVFRVGNTESGSTISGISPLSWIVKGIVSLEPSISVLQLGESLFVAQHYIGIDQTTSAPVSEPEKIVETIKTLKGSEPSIQTVYLLSNSVIEDQLKEALDKIVPVQQMTTNKSSDKLPSYVTTFLEAAARSLAVPDFNVPVFKLSAASPEETKTIASLFSGAASPDKDSVTEDETSAEKSVTSKEDALPKPDKSPTESEEVEKETEEIEEVAEDETDDSENTEDSTKKADDVDEETDAKKLETNESSDEEIEQEEDDDKKTESTDEKTSTSDTTDENKKDDKKAEKDNPDDSKDDSSDSKNTDSKDSGIANVSPVIAPVASTVSSAATNSPITSDGDKKPKKEETALDQSGDDDIDLSQFTQHSADATPTKPTQSSAQSESTVKQPIKHSSGIGTMLKMILVTTIAFVLTIAVGVGVGLGILQFATPQDEVATPVVEVENETPEPETEETPPPVEEEPEEEEVAVDLNTVSVLVVNATSTAGYAGQIRTQLLAGEFEDVTAGNAQGTYEEGIWVYASEGSATVIEAIEDATDLTVTASEDAQAEDDQGDYDVVIVLAE